MTRVKKQLLLVVVDNVKLFTTIQEILTWKTDIQNISFPDDIKQEIKKLEESSLHMKIKFQSIVRLNPLKI